MALMKTPGVYVVEKTAFPNTVVEVATAVAAFIGYTEKAEKAGNDGQALVRKPWPIASMTEFEQYFGGPPQPCFTLKVVDDPTADPSPAIDMRGPRPQVSTFEHQGRTYRLTRAAGKAGHGYRMHAAMRHFFQNGGGPCYVVSVGVYGDAASAPEIDGRSLIDGIALLLKEQEPTLVVVPDAVSLPSADCAAVQAAMLMHCGGEMRNRFAILDVWGGDCSRQDPAGDCIDSFRNALGPNFLDFGAAYYPWVHTTLMQTSDFRYWMVENTAELAALIGDALQLDTRPVGDPQAEPQRQALADVAKAQVDPGTRRIERDESLLAMSTLYARVRDEALRQMNLMPPSAAMAGLYTAVDHARGVWAAPANIAMAGVLAPAVAISGAEQEDLRAPLSGKSINAIRSFTGEGVLVWGARTLDGNSLDWRDVNLRRTMIMLEESCKLATKAFVFEPNTVATWTTLQAMIARYLTGVWQHGGLMGATPEDAFSVQVGLGQTMTPDDVLEGVLRITVLVALRRPAEFIEITFQQQMQKS
ncbi:tail protein [Pseudacidovorax intermedius]|uniref:Tail protein n=2 Tax=Pseudacidovorax intermedius TaxID=433924 RepID=A0A147H3W2_9BURK|nr:tail protein [Pseudacidovorax intermedius]